MNRQTFVRFLLVGLLLALLAVPVLGAVSQPAVAGDSPNNFGHFITIQGKGTPAGPSAVIACTPPSSGNGCGGG